MGNVILRMLVIFIIILLGVVVRKAKLIPEDGDKGLSSLVIYIGNPALIFYSVLSGNLEITKKEALFYVMISFVFYAVLILVGKVMSYFPLLKTIPRKHIEAMLVFTNMGFIGLPVIQSIYGDGAIFYIAIMGIPFNILVYSYGVYLLGKESSRLPLKNMLNPSIITAVVVLFLFFLDIPIPGFFMDLTDMVGGITVPLALIIVGYNLARESILDILRDKVVYLFLLLKLLLYPAVIFLLFRPFVKNPVFFGVMVIVAAMPVGSNVSMINREYGEEKDSAAIAKCTVLSTVVSAIAIPIWAAVLLT